MSKGCILCVTDRIQVTKLKEIISELIPAFVLVADVRSHGEGSPLIKTLMINMESKRVI